MTVKRETLSKQMEAVTESHSARQEALNATATEINEKISKYAVIKQTKTTTEAAAAAATKDKKSAKKGGGGVKSKELAEVEAELEVSIFPCAYTTHIP